MRIFEETQRFNQWWLQLINIALLGFLAYCAYTWYFVGTASGNVGPNDLTGQVVVFIAVLLSIGLIYIFKLETRMDEQGIHYRFLPIHRSFKTIRWTDLEECYTRTYRPLTEYGGWGYRFGRGNGKALNVKGNQGIQTKQKNGTKLLIGTQKPDDAQRIIKKYFRNERV